MVIAKSKEPPLVIKIKFRPKFDEISVKNINPTDEITVKNINSTDEITVKTINPGLYKNDNGTFTLVRKNGTSRVCYLLEIQEAVDDEYFTKFLEIHFQKKR